jgi:ABC-2 type transport system ATP-binding protein
MTAISIKNLKKTFSAKTKEPGIKGSIKSLFCTKYKHTHAIDGIDLHIAKGELVGFIGPNGAGKSTTIKILTGILFPDDKSEVEVLGITPWKERKKLAHKIGTVFGQRSQLWMHLPAQDSFDLIAAIYDIEEKEYKARLIQLTKTFEIEDLINVPVRKLSLGQRMRCELVAALLHNPEILYLDEPSIGLDIIAKKILREQIRRINKQGVTVILTSHDMDDIEELCSRVVIINHGKIIHDSSYDDLKKQYLHKKIIKVFVDKKAKEFKKSGIKTISSTEFETILEIDLKKIEMHETLKEITTHFMIKDIEIQDPPIEEIIEELYSKGKDEMKS